jgi:hypothetical protein
MAMGRKFIFIIIIVVILIGVVYVGYRFRKVYKGIETDRVERGYSVPCKELPPAVFKKGKWKGILIDADINFTDGAHNIVPYDLDNDGKIELVANSYRSDTLIFYKYDGNPQDPLNWSRYVVDSDVGGGIPRSPIVKYLKSTIREKLIGGFTGGAHYTSIADMNGDGRDDLIVAGDLKRFGIVWYEAPRDIEKIAKWKKHVVHQHDLLRIYHVETGDIDGDGNQDIVFTTKTDNGIGWLKNNGSLREWPVIWIDNNCGRCFNARVADIDRDGQSDIIASEDDSANGGVLHFYTYSNNPMLQQNWIDHAIACFSPGHGVSIFEIIDIDNDGDLDIVTGNHQGDVYILKNPYPDNTYEEWNRFKVNDYDVNSGHDFREIDVGDIDSDGDYDIIVADEGKNTIIWFENPGNAFSENWARHIVDKSDQYLKWCHCVELGDIDSNGYLDVAVAAPGSNIFMLYFKNVK